MDITNYLLKLLSTKYIAKKVAIFSKKFKQKIKKILSIFIFCNSVNLFIFFKKYSILLLLVYILLFIFLNSTF